METRRIWKFPLVITDEQHIVMPIHPEFLAVQFQGKQLCVWAAVEPENAPRPHRITIVGTGHPLPEDRLYIGTVQEHAGALVWHVFEG